jgi:hypothetical protein
MAPLPPLPLFPVHVKVVPPTFEEGTMFKVVPEHIEYVPAGTLVPAGTGFTVTTALLPKLVARHPVDVPKSLTRVIEYVFETEGFTLVVAPLKMPFKVVVTVPSL